MTQIKANLNYYCWLKKDPSILEPEHVLVSTEEKNATKEDGTQFKSVNHFVTDWGHDQPANLRTPQGTPHRINIAGRVNFAYMHALFAWKHLVQPLAIAYWIAHGF